jgi:DNA polymerase-3 subunit delta'
MTAALAFAGALLCSEPPGTDGATGGEGATPVAAVSGCGRCRGCRLVAGRQHPDLHVIVPTPPEKNPKGPKAIRIDDVREVERQAALRPLMATRKVFIVDDADRMTEATPQAFLKTLEEPPARTLMILIVPTVRALPATVLSRCQIVKFPPRPDEASAALRAEAAAFFAEVRSKGAEALFRRLGSIDREKAEELVDAYWLRCRDLLLARAGAPPALLVNAEAATDIASEAERWSFDELLVEIQGCREARTALGTNVSPRLTLEVLLSRLALRAA